MNNQQIAKNWRTNARRPEHKTTGYVVILHGNIEGWTSTLYSLKSWQPGSVAVGINGSEWVAVGGSVTDGAERWEKR